MIEILAFTLLIGTCVYVAAPLLQKQEGVMALQSEQQIKVSELLHQHDMLQKTIQDLEFDHETDKLSDADFQELLAEHRKAQADVDARLKNLSGISASELVDRLEAEIEQEKLRLQPEAVSRCPNCHNVVSEEDKFCSNCGAKIKT